MKKNILITRGTKEKISPDLAKEIKKHARGDCFVIVGYDDQLVDYKSDFELIKRSDCLEGDYSEYREKYCKNLNFLGETAIDRLKPTILSAMLMERRFEDRIMLQISKELSSHYRSVLNHILFWHDFLISQGIDAVVFSDAPHEVYDYVIYELCKLIGVRTYVYRYFYKTDRFFVMENYHDLMIDCKNQYSICKQHYFEDGNAVELSESVEALYQSVSMDTNNAAFSYDVSLERELNYRFGEKRIDRYIKSSIVRSKENSIKIRSNLTRYINNYFFALKKRNETISFRRRYESIVDEPDLNAKYILFALHLLPESAVEPLGGAFSDQFWAIKIISDNLPEGWRIYVKMHPAQVNMVMTWDEILRFKDIKHVSIISTKCNQKEMIKNAAAVATITGEIALEALFYNKPCLIFGNTYYSVMPTSLTIHDNDDMKKAIRIITTSSVNVSEFERRLCFKAMENASFKGVPGAISEICRRIEMDG